MLYEGIQIEVLALAKTYLELGDVFDEEKFSKYAPSLFQKVIADILLYAARTDIPMRAMPKVGELVALAFLTKCPEIASLGSETAALSDAQVKRLVIGDTTVEYGASTGEGSSAGFAAQVAKNYDLALQGFIPRIRKLTW